MILYSDTFNENSPPTNDPAYISSLGAAVYEAMSKGDNNAVWLMQVYNVLFLLYIPSAYVSHANFILEERYWS